MKNKKDYFFILVRVDNRDSHIKIQNSELLYVEAEGDYVLLQTTKARYRIHSNLLQFTKRLQHILFRCHRSYSVNIENVELVREEYLWVSKYQIPIGEQAKRELLDILYDNKNGEVKIKYKTYEKRKQKEKAN